MKDLIIVDMNDNEVEVIDTREETECYPPYILDAWNELAREFGSTKQRYNLSCQITL